ncbi:Methyltransferase-like protein 2-A [Sarcoptes scabiei]|uniref:tRNA N(3)-methylcytidine methyltransferase n=1 Tax=Sarcoptes scabiei TaxID=52283 RepID=A0A834RC57_SARSC|nr:Methyltransferase-like protein 2-A [Sarcoptes scabiei]UXI20240.1 peptidyl-prolyl cis-trans isomerase-like [Sarcoptes scabiei]
MKNSTNDSENETKRPKFGTRFLKENSDIYAHNAWDNYEVEEEFLNEIIDKIDKNSKTKLTETEADELERNASKYWNEFYSKHQNKFFKDRHWILTEFPELTPITKNDVPKKFILEIGCGVGNTVFPLIQLDSRQSLFIYCCDFSENAIELVKQNPLYNEEHCRAFVQDITGDWTKSPIRNESLDIITMIFVLSAIDSDYHCRIIRNLLPFLKPNGLILFRDYGQFDMAQIRFGDGHCIKDKFYVRGDRTRAYFFAENEVEHLFEQFGLEKIQLNVDRRLQVNRANRKKMYRVWIQAIYRKSDPIYRTKCCQNKNE